MKKKYGAALVALLASLSAQADVLTFTDRSAFEAAVAGHTVDNLNDVTDGGNSTLDRGAYKLNIQHFGCNSGPFQCGDNSAQGFAYPAYIWTYGGGTFEFARAINAFGIDFGAYQQAVAHVSLNGHAYSSTNGGFFGIIDTANSFTTVNYGAGGSGSLLDNVTYGVAGAGASEVPEPGSIALFAIALAGVGALRRRTV